MANFGDTYPSDVPTGNDGYVGGTSGGGLVGAIVNAGAGMYDSYQNRKTSKENTAANNAAAKAEAELAYQRSVQMWHMQNAYNSPEAQMQRFKNAGLNPHLIYGQGNSGNASSMPQYQPANIQYRHAAAQYGAGVQSILPVLMSVGTWMQNMRLQEADLRKKTSDTMRVEQLVEYLTQANPRLIRKLDNTLDLFPHQYNMQQFLTGQAYTKLSDMEQDFRFKYGDDLFQSQGSFSRQGRQAPIGGMRRLQYMAQADKNRILGAQSSWTDFNITNPQALMQLVLSGVMGMAGQTLRARPRINPKARTIHETETRMRGGRTNFRRRIYER